MMINIRVKFGFSHCGRNTDWGCSWIGFSEPYFDREVWLWEGSGGDSLMKSVMVCIPYQMSLDVIKWWRTRCSGNMASVGNWGVAYRFLMEKSEGEKKNTWENLSIIWKMIFKWIFRNRVERRGLEWSACVLGHVADSCELGIEIRVPQNTWHFLTLKYYEVFKNDSA